MFYNRMHKRPPSGMSFIEVLLVIALVGVLTGIGANQLMKARQRAVLNAESEALVRAVRETQSRAITSHDGLAWGFSCIGNTWDRFSFDAAGEVRRESFSLAAPLTCESSQAIRFGKLTGIPTANAAITVNYPAVGRKRIEITQPGTINLFTL